MGRISNRSLYPNDNQVSLDDFFIGTDRDNQDATRTYPLSGLFATFQSALDLASIQFTFSDGTDPELDENDAGYFTTNSNQTSAPAVTAININTLDANALDVTSILSVVDDQPTAFTLRVTKPNVTNQIFFFAISGITDNLDGTYTLTVSNFIGTNSLQDGTTYSFVFDLSGVPSIYTETDPIFTASPAGSILAGDITNWNTAFAWGNHATAGYQDALGGTGIVKSTAGTISYVTDNSANWNTAFSWGNHATAGYLTSFTETDPVFSASAAAGVTSVLIGQWNAAYSWGDHALAGYITSESDPVFTASVAAGITLADTQNWDSAYSWGDHDGLYLPLSGGTMTGNINMGNLELQNATKVTINNTIWAGSDTIEMDFDSIDLFGIGKFGTTKIVYSVSSDKWTVAGRDLSLNLYEVNGSLTGTRTVTMGVNQLNWSSGSGDIVMNSGRLGVKQQVFGGSRLGDSEFQAANIDTQAINFKDTGQATALAMFFSAVGGSDGYVTTMKNFVDSVNVISVAGLGQETFGGVGREVEATVGLRNDFTGGEFRVFDTFNNDYDAATAVAEAQGWVAIHGGGATAKKIGLWRYDTTTYTEILGVSPTNVITFGFDVNVPTEVYGAGWSGSTEVPTKGDLYTKIETLGSASALNDLSDVTITGAAKGDILVYNGTAWVDLTVGTNGQILSANSAQATGLEWIAAPTSAVWGSITGTLSNQTDLQAALDGKSNTGHTHTTSDITNLSSYTGFDTRYYTETEADSRFVNVTGDTMTGQLTVSGNIVQVTGASPRLTLTEDGTTVGSWNVLVDGDNLDIRNDGTADTIARFADTYINLYENTNIVGSTDTADAVIRDFSFANNANLDSDTRAGILRVRNDDGATGTRGGYFQFVVRRPDTPLTFDFPLNIYHDEIESNVNMRIDSGTLTLGVTSVQNGNLFFQKSDGAQMWTAWEDNYYRYRRGGGGTVAGWRWDNFDSAAMTLSTGGDLTIAGTTNSQGVLIASSNSGNNFRIYGSGTGTGSIGYMSIYESNGTTRQGYMGFGSATNSDLTLYNDVGTNYIQVRQNGTILLNPSNTTNLITYNGILSGTTVSSRDKIRVWTAQSYSMGMQNFNNYGGLNNDYAMTFNMNNDNDRGWLWCDDAHTTSQGAMSLTTTGILTIAAGIRVGYGESDTTILGATYDIQVSGEIQASDFVLSSDIRKKENVKELYDNGRFRFVEYNYIDADRKRYGIIANEAEIDYPELVIIDDEGYRSASYTDLLVYEHVQQEKEIAELKQEVADLKKDIEIIKMMLKDGKL